MTLSTDFKKNRFQLWQTNTHFKLVPPFPASSDEPICFAQDSEHGYDNEAVSIDKNDDKGKDELNWDQEVHKMTKDDEQENDEEHDGFEDNILSLNKEMSMSKHSFISANSDSSEQRRKLIQNLKPNSSIFTDEETTYKPPRRAKPGQKQGKIFFIDIYKFNTVFSGKTGKFFFGKVNMKPQTSQQAEREPIKASDKKSGVVRTRYEILIFPQCVILDVGGERFIAQRNALLKYPTTRLGKLMRSATISGESLNKIDIIRVFTL